MRSSQGPLGVEQVKPHRAQTSGQHPAVSGTIIDLREPQIALACRKQALNAQRYRSVPLYFESAQGADAPADIYRLLLEGRASRLVAVIRAIAETGEGAEIINCYEDAESTGLIGALVLETLGVQRSQIINRCDPLSCLSVTGERAKILARFSNQLAAAAPLDSSQLKRQSQNSSRSLSESLDWVQATYGSVANYLLSNGLTEEELLLLQEIPAHGLRSRNAMVSI